MAEENVEKSSNLLAFDADDYSQHNTSRYEAEKIPTEFRPNSSNSCGCYCKDFTLQVKRIQDEIQSLQCRLKDDYTTTSPCNNDLLLRRENVRLQSDLESAKSAIKQLESKVHELQSEKSSLITVIRLMQEDGQHGNYSDKKNNTNDQEDSPWTVVKKPKRKKKKSKRATREKLSDAAMSTATKDNTPQSLSGAVSVEQNATYNSNDQGKTPGNNDNIQTEISSNKNKKTPKPAKVIIAGDSLIKHLNGFRMSTIETRVQIATFLGATTLDMTDHIKAIQRKRQDKLILHVGTYNLRGRGAPSKHAEEIISLAESVKNTLPETEILISGLINRVDDDALGNKVDQVNTAPKQMCCQHLWKFIEHSNIVSSHLNRSGIHLNKMGTAKLSHNFNKYIYNKNDLDIAVWESNNTCLQQGEDDTQIVEGFGELNTTNINISTKPFLKGMVMACLNINSLLAHIDELSIYISSRKIDILCINETKLDHTINDREVCLPGFEIARRDRKVNGRNGGGVCLYIRSNIYYKVRYDLQSEILENLVVEITKPRSKSILVSTWYRPPDSPVSLFNEFETMIGELDAENLEFFLLGDLNVDLTPSIKSSNKSTLAELFDIYGLSQMFITMETQMKCGEHGKPY